ncbi:MAG: thioredoxin-disulfide reductase [Firmicutes bacterium]|jgi:thioredoxin reductase (NADPH)|nr:thioredoxin-disulfide reductase [Bacillota bacterium]
MYDIVIIGGGPAGLTAGLYAGRAKLKTLIVEQLVAGGQAATTDLIENYPGVPEGSTGPDITERMEEQAKKFGCEFIMAEVTGVDFSGKEKVIKTTNGEFKAKAVIIASGATHRKLGCPGETEFTGRGVSYCATCDAAFYEDLPVAVVGGGDSAISAAIYLTKFASKVYVIHRRDALRATKVVQEKAFANPKIEIVWDSIVDEVKGSETVEALRIKNVKTGQFSDLPVNGVFMYVGLEPNTKFLNGHIKLDAKGYVPVTSNMETDVPGVFAAGDVTVKLLRQVVTAVGDGATAAVAAEKYIEDNF